MNVRALQSFAAIVETGSFERAAAKVHVSQPALSRQLRTLEGELGVRLFERAGRRARLTQEGEDLLRRARRVIAEYESLVERARSLKSGEAGLLRIGATPPSLETLVSPFLAGYLRRHPKVEVEVLEEGGARLPERLERGDVQVACLPAGDARFTGRLLAPTHLVAAVSHRHRLASRSTLEVSLLSEERLLVLAKGFGSRAWFDAACELAHIVPRIVLQSVAAHTLVELAASGYGLAIVPSTARFPKTSARLLPLVQRGQSIGRWQMAAWHPARELSQHAQQFVAELVDYSRHSYPGRAITRRAPALARPKDLL